MDEAEFGWIEVDALGLRRIREYADEIQRIKSGVRQIATEIDALDVPGSSALASQLLELIDPLQYLQTSAIMEDNDNPPQESQEF